ncbi:hypothetical protein NQ314_004510 [Rhamnusium bicolor]|uniref:DUF4371 domain-containing protein n=1 Tax=Rhamnusium bicolor TaxID=1586634 RepID=A0AAV8ZJQ4_9CUCU|nr:hypothetical protein NQ314_004510 [Rhamnusium bicolor]
MLSSTGSTNSDEVAPAAKKAKRISHKKQIDLPEYKDWLRSVPENQFKAQCVLCKKEFVAELSVLKKHGISEKQKTNINAKEKQKEIQKLPEAYPSAALKQKTLSLILLVDESTDMSTTKTACIVVSYFDEELGKITTSLWEYIPTFQERVDMENQGTAEHFYQLLIDTFLRNKISLSNIIRFASDGCNMMMGQHNSIASNKECVRKAGTCVTLKVNCDMLSRMTTSQLYDKKEAVPASSDDSDFEILE